MFWNYLLGLKFMVYTDNNSLAYIKTRKFAAAQIQWCSKLALFNFNIQYPSGETNKAADASRQCPVNQEVEMEGDSDNDTKDSVVLSYATICETLSTALGVVKIPYSIKRKSRQLAMKWGGD